jgi:hypothetical protein
MATADQESFLVRVTYDSGKHSKEAIVSAITEALTPYSYGHHGDAPQVEVVDNNTTTTNEQEPGGRASRGTNE